MSIIQKYNSGETQLNKLKFKPNMGNDHPGNPPLVQKRIPTGQNPSAPFSGNIISTKIDDLLRMGQIWIRNQGLTHLANQALLGTSQPLSYNPGGSLKDKKSSLKDGGLSALKNIPKYIFNTLKQVAVNGTGTHFIRGGNAPNPLMRDPFGNTSAQGGIANRGATAANRGPYTGNVKQLVVKTFKGGNIDTLNMIGPVEKDPAGNYGEDLKDLIKFNFEVLRPEGNPIMLFFRAYLDTLNDSFTGNWSGKKYLGRAEDFYTYQGFSRSVNIGFKIAASTRAELRPLYQKLNFLASTTAPTYGTAGIMRGTLIRATVGDYLASVPGYLSAVNLSWSNEYPWEIVHDDTETVQQLPVVLSCTLSFTPIHEFAPQTGLYHYITNKDNTSVPGKAFFEDIDNSEFADTYNAGIENMIENPDLEKQTQAQEPE